MHYPWWYVPFATAPMLIAAIAVIHVLVSHYAVGGGLFLAFETRHAYKTGKADYLDYLRQHAWFFILLTVVFGAITGVGIWWIIGLASPLATEVLIHNFVFGWATEWCFFVIELAAGFIFYYYWKRLDPATHTAIGFAYAGAAWISLVLITGITAFMLDPGRWPETHDFWDGFLNPQFLPQTLARTGGSLLLASLYVYFHASLKARQDTLRRYIELRSIRPALLGSALVSLGGLWWYAVLPESAKAALHGAAVLNVLMIIVFALTIATFALLYLGPYRHPGWLSPGFAIVLLGLGFAALTTGEYIREAIRKPYVSYNVVLGNQILASDVRQTQADGFMESGVWTRAYLRRHYPRLLSTKPGEPERVDEAEALELPILDQVKLGALLYQYHCNDCHATTEGLSAAAHLTRGWDDQMLYLVARYPDKAHFFMPPWSGTDEEAQLLVEYLKSIQLPNPGGMYLGNDEPAGELHAGVNTSAAVDGAALTEESK